MKQFLFNEPVYIARRDHAGNVSFFGLSSFEKSETLKRCKPFKWAAARIDRLNAKKDGYYYFLVDAAGIAL